MSEVGSKVEFFDLRPFSMVESFDLLFLIIPIKEVLLAPTMIQEVLLKCAILNCIV